MAPSLSLNDGVLTVSLLYLSIDMQYQWHEFASCHNPVHRWLLVSYIFILAFRLMHVLGSSQMATGTGDFLLNLRTKDALPKLLMSLTWLLVMPLFTIWTALGTFWLYDSKWGHNANGQCLPMGMPLVFVVAWQGLSWAWIFIHATLGGVAWILERRLRRTEDSLRSMEDSDTLSRWGNVSQISGYTDLANNELKGLAPDQIKELPESVAGMLQLPEDAECSICLNGFEPSDAVRQLGTCSHTFHRSCIDLWLLRRADCPLCKQNVIPDSQVAAHCCTATEHWHV